MALELLSWKPRVIFATLVKNTAVQLVIIAAPKSLLSLADPQCDWSDRPMPWTVRRRRHAGQWRAGAAGAYVAMQQAGTVGHWRGIPRMGMGRGRAQLANGEHPKPRSRLAGDRDKKTETTRGLGDRFHCAHVAPCLHATCPSSLRDTCSAGTSLKSVDGAPYHPSAWTGTCRSRHPMAFLQWTSKQK